MPTVNHFEWIAVLAGETLLITNFGIGEILYGFNSLRFWLIKTAPQFLRSPFLSLYLQW